MPDLQHCPVCGGIIPAPPASAPADSLCHCPPKPIDSAEVEAADTRLEKSAEKIKDASDKMAAHILKIPLP